MSCLSDDGVVQVYKSESEKDLQLSQIEGQGWSGVKLRKSDEGKDQKVQSASKSITASVLENSAAGDQKVG